MNALKQSFALLLGLSVIRSSTPLDNGVALTPPMGWIASECNIDCEQFPNSCVSENLFLAQATEILNGGYREAGYEFININDCWSEKKRDEAGDIVADKHRFPSGMRQLSKQVHTMGLKLGLQGDVGSETCSGYPGFGGHFERDFQKMALDYQIDLLKVDVCDPASSLTNATFPHVGELVQSTGRPIVLDCGMAGFSRQYSNDPAYQQMSQHCNQWRNYYDTSDTWRSILSIIDFWSSSSGHGMLVRAAGPGYWNDLDVLHVGSESLSVPEQQAQFSLWAIFAAPLFISVDLRTMSEQSKAILTNQDIIDVNQDKMGRQGWCASDANQEHRVYVRELLPSNGTPCQPGKSDTWAVALANFNEDSQEAIMFDPIEHLPNRSKNEIFSARDLLSHKEYFPLFKNLVQLVDERSVKMYKITLMNHTIGEESRPIRDYSPHRDRPQDIY